MTSERPPGPTRPAADREEAVALGARLADAVDDPDAFVAALEAGLARLAGPSEVVPGRVAPASRTGHVVRAPLHRLVRRRLGASLPGTPSSTALSLAAHLERSASREIRLFALPLLEHALAVEPERTWQSLRRLARGAGDRTEVASLAAVWAQGVLAEPFRWAELEQLVYSARAMERVLVGATLASIARSRPASLRERLRDDLGRHALPTLGMLMGDADDAVQRSLASAIRAWTPLDEAAMEAFLRDQAAIAEEHRDGHRARVIRDALAAQPLSLAEGLRPRVRAIRRTPAAASTSLAARQAGAFAALGLPDPDALLAVQGERFARARG